MNYPKFVIHLAACFFLLYGFGFILAPVGFSQWVVGSSPSGTSFLIDFRATYGGMTTGVGILLIYLSRVAHQQVALVSIIVVLMSMALARGVGFLVDGLGNHLMMLYLILEKLGSLGAWIALQSNEKNTL